MHQTFLGSGNNFWKGIKKPMGQFFLKAITLGASADRSLQGKKVLVIGM